MMPPKARAAWAEFEAEVAARCAANMRQERLHEAAPDLLAALIGMISCHESQDGLEDAFRKARAAIAKADGR